MFDEAFTHMYSRILVCQALAPPDTLWFTGGGSLLPETSGQVSQFPVLADLEIINYCLQFWFM